MQRNNRELWLAVAAILLITLAYGLVLHFNQGTPAAGSLFGHGIGILGFVLMLMTEILYTLRKRARTARWGRMATWLRFHIFTGLVGPYMVLLHTAWKFNGLAGALVLLTVVIVVSGFVGRYIYTAVPRTADGVVVEANELERQSQAAEAELHQWMAAQPEAASLLAGMLAPSPQPAGSSPALVFERSFLDWKYRRQWQQVKRGLPAQARSQVAQLEGLEMRKRVLSRQIESLAMARRMLGLWHSIHMPIGVVLFTVAFIHIGAVLYFVITLR